MSTLITGGLLGNLITGGFMAVSGASSGGGSSSVTLASVDADVQAVGASVAVLATAVAANAQALATLQSMLNAIVTILNGLPGAAVNAMLANATMQKTFLRASDKYGFDPDTGVQQLLLDDGVTVMGTNEITAIGDVIVRKA